MWELLLAFGVGFVTQWVYHPGAASSMVWSMAKITCTMAGTLLAFWYWYK